MISMHLGTNDYNLSIRKSIESFNTQTVSHKQYGKTVMKFNGKEMWK